MKKLFMILLILTTLSIGVKLIADENIKGEFESKYERWKEYISTPEVMVHSIAGPRYNCSQFQEIINLGLPVLPYIFEKMEQDPEGEFLWKAVEIIAKLKIRGKFDKETNLVFFPDYSNLKANENVYLYWWHEGRKQTPQRFEALYKDWKSLKKQGKEKEAEKKYQGMKDLVIVAIPNFIEKIEKEKEFDLIPALEYLTDGEISQVKIKNIANDEEKIKFCVDWWNKNKEKWKIPVELPESE